MIRVTCDSTPGKQMHREKLAGSEQNRCPTKLENEKLSLPIITHFLIPSIIKHMFSGPE